MKWDRQIPLSLVFKTVLTLLVPLPFHTNFRTASCISMKCFGEIWVGIVLNLCLDKGKIDFVLLLPVPVHKGSIYLAFFRLLSLLVFCSLQRTRPVCVLLYF